MKLLLFPLLATLCLAVATSTRAAEINQLPADEPAVAEKSSRAAPSRNERPKDWLPYLGISIPILFIVIGGAWLMLHTWCDFRKRRMLIELHHRERMAALEKGLDLPPLPENLLKDKDEPEPPEKPADSLADGLWWLGLGIGLAIWLSCSTKPWAHPALATLPVGIGLAQLIYYCLKGRDAKPPVK